MSNIYNLPGIKTIEIILASKFKGEVISNKMKIQCDFTEICVLDIAEFTETPEIVDGQTIYSIVGRWDMHDTDEIDLSYYNENIFVFKLTDIYNHSYLLGNNEKPYPIFNVKKGYGGSPSGQRKLTAEVQYSNIKGLIPII